MKGVPQEVNTENASKLVRDSRLSVVLSEMADRETREIVPEVLPQRVLARRMNSMQRYVRSKKQKSCKDRQ